MMMKSVSKSRPKGAMVATCPAAGNAKPMPLSPTTRLDKNSLDNSGLLAPVRRMLYITAKIA